MAYLRHGDENGPYAMVIADSVNDDGDRLTTMEVQCHRFVLAEFNTHRVFSRNSASSRAIPVAKQIERVRTNPALPVSWPAEQKGMQGGEELSVDQVVYLKEDWEGVAVQACNNAEYYVAQGLHKSVVNRLLEPFMWHKIIVSATEWGNFFEQRCSSLAQPEIRAVAVLMEEAFMMSDPMLSGPDRWHLPYLNEAELATTSLSVTIDEWCKISAARCARVSYLTHDGKRDIYADIELFDKLVSARPAHWSPLEHVAIPGHQLTGNFEGWTQLRGIISDGAA